MVTWLKNIELLTMVGRAPVGCGKGRKFESWTFSQKVCRTNCTKHTLKGEDSSLNNSRTLRSYCVAKIYNPPTLKLRSYH